MADTSVEVKGGGEGDGPVKTAKQLKKEAQKREKMEKFLAKKAKEEGNAQKVAAKVSFLLLFTPQTSHQSDL